MARRVLSTGWTVGGIALLIFLVLPPLIGSAQLNLPTEVCIFALFALTYDVLFGFTGLISFGHALFIGLGAYALTIAMTIYQAPMWFALLIVLLAGLGVSIVTGLLALRTRGVYFAMVTLAFAQAAFTLAQSDIGGLTHGENGLLVGNAPIWLTAPGNEAHLYYVAVAALVVGFLLLRLFVSSPAGRVWQAVRENERRALMLGYRPYPFKLLSYVIAGTLATLVGSLYALFVGDVSPNAFSADMTIQLLLMVIIGGAGSLWGAVIGAALVRYLNHYLGVLSSSDFVAGLPNWLHQTLGQPLLIFGTIYLVLVYFFPQGIAGLVQRYLPAQTGPGAGPPAGLDALEVEAAAPANLVASGPTETISG